MFQLLRSSSRTILRSNELVGRIYRGYSSLVVDGGSGYVLPAVLSLYEVLTCVCATADSECVYDDLTFGKNWSESHSVSWFDGAGISSWL